MRGTTQCAYLNAHARARARARACVRACVRGYATGRASAHTCVLVCTPTRVGVLACTRIQNGRAIISLPAFKHLNAFACLRVGETASLICARVFVCLCVRAFMPVRGHACASALRACPRLRLRACVPRVVVEGAVGVLERQQPPRAAPARLRKGVHAAQSRVVVVGAGGGAPSST